MYYALALFAAVLTAAIPGGRLPLRMPAVLERVLAHPAVVPVAVFTLVAAQHAYLALLLDATYHQQPVFGAMTRMPIRFISGQGPSHLATSYGDGFAALVLVESLALFALFWGLAKPTPGKLALVASGMFLACADAVVSPAATSADMYSYVGFSLLGTRAYAPPALAFTGAYSAINAWWHTPMVAAPYGPLWLGIAAAVAACGHALLAKIIALRILGALTLLALAGVLAALRLPMRVVALVALNPALIFEFVANVHNDLFAVLLLLAARYAAQRNGTYFAVAFAAAAGLVKLPFMLFAALAFAPPGPLCNRLRAYGSSVALTAAISWWLGGSSYLEALERHTNDSTNGHALTVILGASALVKVVALVSIGAAFVSGAFFEGAAWALPAVSALLHPWYLSWMLPYAIASEKTLRDVAIALPMVMLITDLALRTGILIDLLSWAAYAWLTFWLIRITAQRLAERNIVASASRTP